MLSSLRLFKSKKIANYKFNNLSTTTKGLFCSNNHKTVNSNIKKETLQIITNKCSMIEFKRHIRNKFEIDCNVVEKLAPRIILNLTSTKINICFASLLGFQYLTYINFLYGFINSCMYGWLYVVGSFTALELILFWKRYNNTLKIKPCNNKNYLQIYFNFVASRQLFKSYEKINYRDKIINDFKIINLTPEAMYRLLHHNIFENCDENNLSRVIDDNKEIFVNNFEFIVRLMCDWIDFSDNPRMKFLINLTTNCISYNARRVLMILEDKCGKKIDYSMDIKNGLTFADYANEIDYKTKNYEINDLGLRVPTLPQA